MPKKSRRTVAKRTSSRSTTSKRRSKSTKRKGVSKQQVKSFAKAIQRLTNPKEGVEGLEDKQGKAPKRRAGL